MKQKAFLNLKLIDGKTIFVDLADIRSFEETKYGTKLLFYSNIHKSILISNTTDEVVKKILSLNNQ